VLNFIGHIFDEMEIGKNKIGQFSEQDKVAASSNKPEQ
jgi:hypothetical protein